MPIITLTTDLGNTDHYVSAVKANILRQLESVNIIDISHNIPTFNVLHAAFVLKNVYKDFPQGSIHIIGVNAEASENTPHIAVYADEHYFIGTDNGLFSLLLDIKADKIVHITTPSESDNENFPIKDVFVKAACHIARGGTLELIGSPADDFINKSSKLVALHERNSIRGSIIHIDHYGNAITNINQRLFNDVAKGRKYSIHLGNKEHYSLSSIKKRFNEVPLGDAMAMFISTGNLVISLNMGSASSLMGLEINDTVRIEFYD
ncbi:MAG: SAM-dependent chlorinase/fluorinase [Flavobacteriales bacterium]|nr:SAM-dependent chlorinase/fluorinase [Flavobacteriales bacterium]MBL6873053.1 SAM-dependent chlorinase/fluorinase [Flavobacteriales bacterium]